MDKTDNSRTFAELVARAKTVSNSPCFVAMALMSASPTAAGKRAAKAGLGIDRVKAVADLARIFHKYPERLMELWNDRGIVMHGQRQFSRGVRGLSYRPMTAKEAADRNPDQRLHDKVLSVRNCRPGRGLNRGTNIGHLDDRLLSLAGDVIFNLAIAIDHGKLSFAARCMLEKFTRAEILCWILQECAYAFNMNKARFGFKRNERWPGYYDPDSAEHRLLDNIYRLTREEVTEKYGAEDWNSRYRPNGEVYISDVEYGRFLRDHGLGYRFGGGVTEESLPPIDFAAMMSSDPWARALARAEGMRRLARESRQKGKAV